jgi:hypothetical protein
VKLSAIETKGNEMIDYISDGAKALLIMSAIWALWHILPA